MVLRVNVRVRVSFNDPRTKMLLLGYQTLATGVKHHDPEVCSCCCGSWAAATAMIRPWLPVTV